MSKASRANNFNKFSNPYPTRGHSSLTYNACYPSTNPIMTPPEQQAASAGSPVVDELSKERNAAAQARHRAKRKAHVAQLEKTVATLRETVKQATTTQRLRQLEDENRRLTTELQHLLAQIESSSDEGSVHGIGGPAYWPPSSSSSAYSGLGFSGSSLLPMPMEYDDNDFDVDPNFDPTEYGLQGWSPSADANNQN